MREKIQQLDYVMIGVLVCFMAISTTVIYSSTSGTALAGYHIRHLMMFSAFFVPMLAVSFFNYQIVNKYAAIVIYGLGMILLILVEFYGIEHNNAVRWLAVGSREGRFYQEFQPSEIMKGVIVIVLAKLLARREGETLEFIRDIVPATLLVLVPFYLVYEQPDLATAIIFIVILIGMLWVAKVRIKHVIIGLIIAAIVVGCLVALYFISEEAFLKIIHPHQLNRIKTFIEPVMEDDWHVRNSIIAISMGGLSGKGLMQGEYVQNGFIPYDYADSIFVVVGEEFGFLGSSVLLLLFFVLIYRMILIAFNCADYFGKYIVIGVVTMLTLQVFQNVAMHLGSMPMTGIPLPFVSFGGSSLLVNMVAVGVVMSVKVHSEKLIAS